VQVQALAGGELLKQECIHAPQQEFNGGRFIAARATKSAASTLLKALRTNHLVVPLMILVAQLPR
jgi:hypothetical protein